MVCICIENHDCFYIVFYSKITIFHFLLGFHFFISSHFSFCSSFRNVTFSPAYIGRKRTLSSSSHHTTPKFKPNVKLLQIPSVRISSQSMSVPLLPCSSRNVFLPVPSPSFTIPSVSDMSAIIVITPDLKAKSASANVSNINIGRIRLISPLILNQPFFSQPPASSLTGPLLQNINSGDDGQQDDSFERGCVISREQWQNNYKRSVLSSNDTKTIVLDNFDDDKDEEEDDTFVSVEEYTNISDRSSSIRDESSAFSYSYSPYVHFFCQ